VIPEPSEKILDALRELANRDIQRRLWLAESGEVSSLTEAMSSLFDDSGLARALERDEVVFGVEIDALLRRLGKVSRLVDKLQNPEDLLHDPRMEAVRSIARQALSMMGRGHTQ